MRSGWNPVRRNRNIGTNKQGHGLDNSHHIPNVYPEHLFFYEQLQKPIAVERDIHGSIITFLVEPARADCVYACTIDDIAHMLHLLPEDDLFGVKLFLLRQPTRKQEIHRPVWGRLLYYAEVGGYMGHAICLEATNPDIPLKWPVSLSPESKRELDRLASHGHEITRGKRHYEIKCSIDSIRYTQLYHTIPHELGHFVDWRNHYLTPWKLGADNRDAERLKLRFDTKTKHDKEAFAHRYADECRKRLICEQLLPFKRMVDAGSLHRGVLHPGWFRV